MWTPPKTLIHDNRDELALGAVLLFYELARSCIESKGRFVTAISGGSTPRAMHRLMAEEPYRSYIPWKHIHLFWVDERCVPERAPESNYGTARRDLLDSVSIPSNQVHPIPVTVPHDEAALHYEQELEHFFHRAGADKPNFDLMLLGIGTDGHTASLFPEQDSLNERNRMVLPVRGGEPDIDRITLTLPAINHARRIVFLVSGRKKASIMKYLSSGRPESKALPAGLVRPVRGKILWMVDEDAASLMSGKAIQRGE